MLFGGAYGASAQANRRTPSSLAPFFGTVEGSAALIDIARRNVIAAHRPEAGAAPPGSTIKPFALAALIQAGKLSEREAFVCPGKLTIAGRQLNCSHPPLGEPMKAETAIAYSCNCFVAHVAERFAPGELARTLDRAGFIHGVRLEDGDGARLQALGEKGVLASVSDLAMAYTWLARNSAASVLTGLEGAVEYGTAQMARVEGMNVAGKTGTVRTAAGGRVAWFAGFAPSREAKVGVAVMAAGFSGGGDAAPVARRILTAYRSGEI